MSGQKGLIIADDEEAGAEELNPFSFRQFLRCKNQDKGQDRDQEQENPHSESSCSHRMFDVRDLTFDSEVRSCFFSEPSLAPQEEEEEKWGRSFHSGNDSTSSLCTEEEEEEDNEEEETRFSSKPDVQQRLGSGGAENYEGDDETSMAEPVSSCRRKSPHVQQSHV